MVTGGILVLPRSAAVPYKVRNSSVTDLEPLPLTIQRQRQDKHVNKIKS